MQQSMFDLPLALAQPPRATRSGRKRTPTIREALAPYLDIGKLHDVLGAELGQPGGDIRYEALQQALRCAATPELNSVLAVVAAALRDHNHRRQIRSPSDVATWLMIEMAALDQEHLRTVLLDTKNRVMSLETVYIGSVNSAMIRVGEVFKPALRANATAIILCHNHPSGDETPSPEDILVTRQIVEAGKLLDCDCLDHLVLGSRRWVSMRERGLGFSV